MVLHLSVGLNNYVTDAIGYKRGYLRDVHNRLDYRNE